MNYDLGKSLLFLGLEPYFGAKRAKTNGEDMNGILQTQNYLMEDILINIGIKYKVKTAGSSVKNCCKIEIFYLTAIDNIPKY